MYCCSAWVSIQQEPWDPVVVHPGGRPHMPYTGQVTRGHWLLGASAPQTQEVSPGCVIPSDDHIINTIQTCCQTFLHKSAAAVIKLSRNTSLNISCGPVVLIISAVVLPRPPLPGWLRAVCSQAGMMAVGMRSRFPNRANVSSQALLSWSSSELQRRAPQTWSTNSSCCSGKDPHMNVNHSFV